MFVDMIFLVGVTPCLVEGVLDKDERLPFSWLSLEEAAPQEKQELDLF